jgi:putative ABC transport system permease protein
MLRDYFRSVWLGVLHNKVAAFINIAGLTLGLTVFFALTFYVQREFSYDAHWEDADRIYRLNSTRESPTGNTSTFIATGPYVVGSTLLSRNAATFEVYTRVSQNQGIVSIDAKEYPNYAIFYAERSLLDLVQLETLQGSLQDVFADPRSVALNTRTAETLFGKESPFGKRLAFSFQASGL